MQQEGYASMPRPSVRVRDGIVTVRFSGDLDIADTGTLRGVLAQALDCSPRVVADLAAVGFIDCAVLGVFVAARNLARGAGGDLLLAGTSGKVARVVGVTGMDGVFPFFPSADDAAGALAALPV